MALAVVMTCALHGKAKEQLCTYVIAICRQFVNRTRVKCRRAVSRRSLVTTAQLASCAMERKPNDAGPISACAVLNVASDQCGSMQPARCLSFAAWLRRAS